MVGVYYDRWGEDKWACGSFREAATWNLIWTVVVVRYEDYITWQVVLD